MALLTANALTNRHVDQELRDYPVGVAQIFRGAAVGVDPAGNLKDFVPGDQFVGIAFEAQDNSSGAVGDLTCRVYVQGDFEVTLTGVALTDVNKAAYATTDNTDDTALSGHTDAFMGRVLHFVLANRCVIRLKNPGEQPTDMDFGHIRFEEPFLGNFTATGAAGSDAEFVGENGTQMSSALGLGVLTTVGAEGGATMQVDAVAEIAHASVETLESFLASGGVTFEATLRVSDIGDDGAMDIDWGFVDGVTTNSRLDMSHADATDIALFHLDGNVANILVQSDNNTTDVAAVDSTIDNATGTDKDFKIIVRPSGVVEFWIDGVRILAATVFAVRTTAVLGAVVNLEKTSNNTTGVVLLAHMRVCGSRA